ncbi:hypothetical protein FJ527_28285 [Mesorhizobium sp. B2-4-18]|uniref:hypothetical protein n=1 Tax=Mesorhizobium sp. B2-4-18 TaxID=2589931 RepID=UPI001129503C|nr:hypothetical protein [Mesorhizobium sp. B2-4-18]TPK70776.1 hypothetical protein FJ527_28285 [Mesorhizobium sp. B2-4-18]
MIGWRENLIANHKAEIVRLRNDIQFVRDTPAEIRAIEDGKFVNLSDEIIDDNLRMIEVLERIIAKTEADMADGNSTV